MIQLRMLLDDTKINAAIKNKIFCVQRIPKTRQFHLYSYLAHIDVVRVLIEMYADLDEKPVAGRYHWILLNVGL